MRDCEEEMGEKRFGCIPQAYKLSACLASRPKKEDRVSRREINSLMDGEAYLSEEARSWSSAPLCTLVYRQQDLAAVFAPARRGVIISQKGNWISAGLTSYQGNQQRIKTLTWPLMRTITCWGLRQIQKKISYMHRTEIKAGTAQAGIYQEQANSHLEWPDLTKHNPAVGY